MAHKLLNEAAGFDRSTLALLSRAFEHVWRRIADNYTGARVIEERRLRLALIILELAKLGERDLDVIKRDAIAIMWIREQQIRSMN